MKLLQRLNQLWKGKRQEQDSSWWAEISTTSPHCIYYFGPFSTSNEAKVASPGYVEDLESEGASDIVVVIQRCQPKVLTIFDEEDHQLAIVNLTEKK